MDFIYISTISKNVQSLSTLVRGIFRFTHFACVLEQYLSNHGFYTRKTTGERFANGLIFRPFFAAISRSIV